MSWPTFPAQKCRAGRVSERQKWGGIASGDSARWITAAQTLDADFEQLTAVTEACGTDIFIAGSILEKKAGAPSPQSFLVIGLIPRGSVTLLLGNKKVGKSAAALQLAVSVARRELEWMGFPLNRDGMRGFAVYLSGEDSEEQAMERALLMSQGDRCKLFQWMAARSIRSWLG